MVGRLGRQNLTYAYARARHGDGGKMSGTGNLRKHYKMPPYPPFLPFGSKTSNETNWLMFEKQREDSAIAEQLSSLPSRMKSGCCGLEWWRR